MLLSDIDIRHLRVFKAVAEEGGFANAQDKLGINQPAISSHIANLEQRLGVRLCKRGRGGFSLTPDGREVLMQTNALLDHVDDYSQKLNAIGKNARHLARVGVVDGILTNPGNPLTNCIRSTKQKFKDIRVRVGIYDHLDCLSELRAKRLDICIVGVDRPVALPDELDSLHMFDELASFYCAPDHTCAEASDDEEAFRQLKSARISAHSFIHNPVEGSLDVILQDENVEIAQSNVESSVYLALSGTHVGLIPDHIAAPWVSRGELLPIAQNRYQVVSAFHALRLKDAEQHKSLEHLWSEIRSAAL